jgi:hypothetical protein
MKFIISSKLLPLAASAGLLCTLSTSAAEQDVSGKWTAIVEGFGGQADKNTLTLSQEGSALKGSYESGFGKSEIEEGKAEGGAISFKITREFGDRKMVSKFSGKVDDKAIKGSLTVDGRDGPREMAWEAYRTPEIDPTGLWKWKTVRGRDGAERDSWVKLKYAKGALTGTYRTTRSQAAITDAVLEGKNISFKVERRFRDRVFTTNYKGVLDGSSIKGSIKSRRGDEEREAEWNATGDTPEADPIGTWAWTTRRGRNGEESESKITIKREGDSLAGTYAGRGDESPIEEVNFEGNTLSFNVTSETDRGKFTSAYSGTIEEDLFEGTIEMQFGERKFNRSVMAKRVLAPAKPVGVWTWSSRRGRNGEQAESKLTLKKSDDGKLGGTLSRGEQESEVGDLKLDGNQLTFTTKRSFGDNSVTIRFNGTFRGDELRGTTQMVSDDASSWESFWSAKRSE